jgi:hypothetical protein
MIKIQDKVREIIFADEEALYALSKGFMNLSAYAKQIQKVVERKTMKTVKPTGIVVALSRIQKELKNIDPLVQDVKINNITTKSPLTELVFEKTSSILDKLSSLYKKIKTTNDDFLTITLSTSDVTVICSDRIRDSIMRHLGEKPELIEGKLASIGISFDPKYYDMPNVTFSLLRRIAQKRISLAETITTHTEVMFIFHQKHLPEIMRLFEIG